MDRGNNLGKTFFDGRLLNLDRTSLEDLAKMLDQLDEKDKRIKNDIKSML